MKSIGVDFGTTNSTLSYFDTLSRSLRCFEMQGASGTPYIPSFIGYDREDRSSTEIGTEVKCCQLEGEDARYSVFSKFKMLLGEQNRERLEEYGFAFKSPVECARDYLSTLINSYLKDSCIDDGKIDNIIITVPEIWIQEISEQETGYLARENLKKICSDLNIPLVRLLSEPQAATAFFLYMHQQKKRTRFNGHVLVFDCGGGTLDIALSKVEKNSIRVLECTGKGNDTLFLGKAGVAFDEAVVRRVYQKNRNSKLSRSSLEFIKLLHDFEDRKIKSQKTVTEYLSNYLREKTFLKKIFTVDSIPFFPEDICGVFDDEIKPVIIEGLNEIRDKFAMHGVDESDPETFRIIMVGGFSAFHLVQRTVKEYFGSTSESDGRFKGEFSLADTSLAIAKGAALVAEGLITIDPVCPMTVGLQVETDMGGGFLQAMDVPILEKGVTISHYREPRYLEGGKIRVDVDTSQLNGSIVIFMGEESRRRRIRLEHSIENIFPNIDIPDNNWKIGFSVNDNLSFTLHAEDKSGEGRATPIGDILQRVSGLILEKKQA